MKLNVYIYKKLKKWNLKCNNSQNFYKIKNNKKINKNNLLI